MEPHRKLSWAWALAALICAALAAPAAASAGADDADAPEFAPGELLVQFAPGVSRRERAAASRELGAKVVEPVEAVPRSELVELPPGLGVRSAERRFESLAEVTLAEPNFVYRLQATPNDPRFPALWGLDRIDAPQAWDLSTGDPSVQVAVIDSGIDTGHPDLAPNVWVNPGEIPGNGEDDELNGFKDDVNGWDFVNEDADPSDDNSHGTHVAGIAGAAGDNGIGVTGVSQEVDLMALKAGDEDGDLFTFDIAAAITYAREEGADIVNASFSGDGTSAFVTQAIQNSPGMLFVAAAGNGGNDFIGDDNDASPEFPCTISLANVVCVAATTSGDNMTTFSNYGRQSVDLAAPGTSIVSTIPGDSVRLVEGFEVDDFGTEWDTGGTNDSWARDLEAALSGDFGLSDSVAADYENDTDSFAQLVSPVSLGPDWGCEVSLSVDHELAEGDALALEGSANGVDDWTQIAAFDGTGDAVGATYALDPLFTGFPQIYLRLRLTTDEAETADGVNVDDLGVSCGIYGFKNGTSMSTPHVAGTAALLLAHYPTYGVSDLRTALLNNVDQLDSLTCRVATGGRLNAHLALTDGASSPPPPQTCPTPQPPDTPITPVISTSEDPPRCGGKKATIVGTKGRDRLKGTRKADVIVGLAGNDTIIGRGGNDRLCGGAGKDRLFGSAGKDRLFGGGGKDRLVGGAGKDRLIGGPGKDFQRQ